MGGRVGLGGPGLEGEDVRLAGVLKGGLGLGGGVRWSEVEVVGGGGG